MITLTQARTALKEVVAEHGDDFRYVSPAGRAPGCYNVWEGKPHCLVAKILAHLGVEVVQLCEADERDGDKPPLSGVDVGEFVHRTNTEITTQALDYLSDAQSKQDAMHTGTGRPTWGTVRDEVEALYAEVVDAQDQ